MMPDWISVVVPFCSGALGVGVAYGAMRQGIREHERRIEKVELKLENQVGEGRCNRLRDECHDSVCDRLEEIKREALSTRNLMISKFEEIARFMGRINGRNHDVWIGNKDSVE